MLTNYIFVVLIINIFINLMLIPNHNFNEKYYLNRKKILQDFLKDEENETLKNIDDTENLVSKTKMILKGIVTGEFNYNQIKEKLIEVDNDLSSDCEHFHRDLENLNKEEKDVEQKTIELQHQDVKDTETYTQKIESLKRELESKEFTIQNMERLYIDLENIIRTNMQKGKEQLLPLDQFDTFVCQNDIIKKECDKLEEEKNNLLIEYNNLLRENLNLKSKDESFEIEKVKDILEEVSTMGTIQREANKRIDKLNTRYLELSKECVSLTNQIKNIINTLESLNIDDPALNKELRLINRELVPYQHRQNKSFTNTYINEEWSNIQPYNILTNNNKNGQKII